MCQRKSLTINADRSIVDLDPVSAGKFLGSMIIHGTVPYQPTVFLSELIVLQLYVWYAVCGSGSKIGSGKKGRKG
jgi:hypothetical protein